MEKRRAPISAQARGQLRRLFSNLVDDASRIGTAVASIQPSLVTDLQRKGGKGADRARSRLIAKINLPPLASDQRSLAWRFLKPVTALPTDDRSAPPRPGVLVQALLLGYSDRPRKAIEPFGLAITLHALGRLLDRSSFAEDPVKAIWNAHDALLALPSEEGSQLFKVANPSLPTGQGAFMARCEYLGRQRSPLAVARTWLPMDMLRDDQDAEMAAWRKLETLAP
jgi:hypothetical protein